MLDKSRAVSFRNQMQQLAELQADIRTARRAPKAERAGQALQLAEQFKGAAAALQNVTEFTGFEHAALFEDGDAIAKGFDIAENVRRKENRLAVAN